MVNRTLMQGVEVKSLVALLLLWCLSTSAAAVIETYEFDNDDLRQRYHYFTDVLRCPKCQNQNLSGSNSPIAADLRRELHRLLQEGYSDADIREYMVSRYGEFILYEPPLNRHTVVLWFFPVVLLGIGALIMVLVLRRRAAPSAAQLDDTALQQRAAQLRAQGREAQRDSSLPDQQGSR